MRCVGPRDVWPPAATEVMRGSQVVDAFVCLDSTANEPKNKQLLEVHRAMKTFHVFGLAAILLGTTSSLSAATLTLELDHVFGGPGTPAGATPWLTATFDDSIGGSSTVRLTMAATNLVAAEQVTEWYFNVDPSISVSELIFAKFDDSDVDSVVASKSDNNKQADESGKYDFVFSFSPGVDPFNGGDSVVFDIKRNNNGVLSASSFDFLSVDAGGAGPYASAAQVQSIGLAGETAWIHVVPEPTTAVLGLLAAVGLCLGWRRRRRRSA